MPYLLRHESDMKCVNRYLDTWPAAIRVLEAGVLDKDKIFAIIARRVKIDRVINAPHTPGGKILVKFE